MNEQESFEAIVDSLHEAMLDEARWAETSALIDEAVGAKGSILTFGEEPSRGQIEIYFSKCYYRGIDRSAWQEAYYRDYHATDEHLPRLRALPDSRIVHVTDLFDKRELKTSAAYNEGMRRFEFRNGLNVRLDGPGGSRIVWGIADPIDASGWSSSRMEMIARVLPHLRQYVRVRSAVAEAGALGTSMTELLANTRVGVIQLDRRGRIVEANDRARRLLHRNDGLSDRSGVLQAGAPEDNDRLQGLLARALPRFGGQGSSGSMTVSRPSLQPRLALHVKPVAHRGLDYRSRCVAALVLLADPMDRVRLDPDLVEAVLGLTPAETRIAILLAEGWTPRQIAAATGRGYSTVRTHLKHMFVKLRVSRQLEVAQLVLALSSLPVPRDQDPPPPG